MLLVLDTLCSAMLVFGGYDGQLLSDVVKIQFCEFVSTCTHNTNATRACHTYMHTHTDTHSTHNTTHIYTYTVHAHIHYTYTTHIHNTQYKYYTTHIAHTIHNTHTHTHTHTQHTHIHTHTTHTYIIQTVHLANTLSLAIRKGIWIGQHLVCQMRPDLRKVTFHAQQQSILFTIDSCTH